MAGADAVYKQEFESEMAPKLAALKKPAPNVMLPAEGTLDTHSTPFCGSG